MIDGLKADEYSEWIDKKIEIDEDFKAILREFLIGSPAYGVSRKGRNLFDYYQYTGVDEYSALYMELVGSITDISYSIT